MTFFVELMMCYLFVLFSDDQAMAEQPDEGTEQNSVA
jgi:hypothetical protein